MINNLNDILPQDPILHSLSIIGILLLASFLGYGVTAKIIVKLITKIFSKTSTKIDDILINRKVFNRLAYMVPALILYNFANTAPQFTEIIQKISLCLMLLSGILVINSFLNALTDIYQQTKYSERLNIKSYVQISKLIMNVLGIIAIIALLLEKDPTLLISGLGAMTAVLMLIFKDTILSLVASLQISSNDLFKVGDWIEAPQFGADGDVIDIALHTVKIQNWDKTISIIPTHKLIDSTFKNWRGMSESGGRRIKRSLFLDMNTITTCTPEDLEKYKNIELIKNYVQKKQTAVKEHNEINNVNTSNIMNGRQLTNIGTFRAYIEAYLRNHSNIHENMTFLVRQLELTDNGLPIQIYVFSNDTNWVNYEGIQSDIFDHLLAMASQFGLKIFQNPTGQDFNKLSRA